MAEANKRLTRSERMKLSTLHCAWLFVLNNNGVAVASDSEDGDSESQLSAKKRPNATASDDSSGPPPTKKRATTKANVKRASTASVASPSLKSPTKTTKKKASKKPVKSPTKKSVKSPAKKLVKLPAKKLVKAMAKKPVKAPATAKRKSKPVNGVPAAPRKPGKAPTRNNEGVAAAQAQVLCASDQAVRAASTAVPVYFPPPMGKAAAYRLARESTRKRIKARGSEEESSGVVDSGVEIAGGEVTEAVVAGGGEAEALVTAAVGDIVAILCGEESIATTPGDAYVHLAVPDEQADAVGEAAVHEAATSGGRRDEAATEAFVGGDDMHLGGNPAERVGDNVCVGEGTTEQGGGVDDEEEAAESAHQDDIPRQQRERVLEEVASAPDFISEPLADDVSAEPVTDDYIALDSDIDDDDDGDSTETEFHEDCPLDFEEAVSDTESDDDLVNADDILYQMSQDRDLIRDMKAKGWTYGMRWPPIHVGNGYYVN
ncbi:hypothetical protein BBJ28_00002038 [Nothophytophthora sp. Chile5]|nr:hypothetical protein BBJ28_00002038 [Nothophytophthora sp. Chile5]